MSEPAFRPRPGASADGVSAPFWEGTRRGEFRIQRCRRCATAVFYPRYNCTQCGARELDWEPISGRGTVHTYTIARRATHPAFAERVPYVIAIVALDEGPRVTTNVVGCEPDAVRIGMRVALTFEAEHEGVAIPLFRPAEETAP